MRISSRALIAALMAAIVLAAAVDAAQATRLETSETRIRAVWPLEEKVRWRPTGGGFVLISCPLTLEGTFSRPFQKVSGSHIGELTRAITSESECEGGRMWMLNGTEVQNFVTLPNTLPWEVRYDSFAGTLPNITAVKVQIIGMRLLVKTPFGSCLYRSEGLAPQFATFVLNAAGEVTGLRAESSSRIGLWERQEGTCETTGALERTATRVTVQGAATRIRITLVA
jgi:hypothetical protein